MGAAAAAAMQPVAVVAAAAAASAVKAMQPVVQWVAAGPAQGRGPVQGRGSLLPGQGPTPLLLPAQPPPDQKIRGVEPLQEAVSPPQRLAGAASAMMGVGS